MLRPRNRQGDVWSMKLGGGQLWQIGLAMLVGGEALQTLCVEPDSNSQLPGVFSELDLDQNPQ